MSIFGREESSHMSQDALVDREVDLSIITCKLKAFIISSHAKLDHVTRFMLRAA